MARRKAGWLGAWTALSKVATKHTLKTQKKVSTNVAKIVGKAVGEASAKNAAKVGAATRRVLTGVISPAPAPTNRGSGHWQEGHWGLGPLAQRKYRLFTPEGVSRKHPARLLVLLHGCGQDSASFAASTHAAAIARAQGCMVLLPEQSSHANAQRCWNWFRSDARVATEAMLLMAIVERVCSQHFVQHDAVYLLGMSAGGSMALTMALRYPDRFAGVVCHSGAVPHSAANAVQATHAMQGHRGPDNATLKNALTGRRLPPLLLLHGDHDRTVVPDNALASAGLWLELLPGAASAMPAPVPTPGRLLQRGARKACTINDWKTAGRLYVRLIRIAGLGHAWSGGAAHQAFSDPAGPDALKLALRFFDDCAT
ncbi:MAG TPA: PHB depolymerase family esterase [Rhodocyclaceae bacterium]|nr:PHB depolymerase family esterase [Rhodocyclaceae bacterium]